VLYLFVHTFHLYNLSIGHHSWASQCIVDFFLIFLVCDRISHEQCSQKRVPGCRIVRSYMLSQPKRASIMLRVVFGWFRGQIEFFFCQNRIKKRDLDREVEWVEERGGGMKMKSRNRSETLMFSLLLLQRSMVEEED
jgi:hypothetical protein